MVLDDPQLGASLFYFGANLVALTASLLVGFSVLISDPKSFNARIFAGVLASSACYVLGRLSYAVPHDVQVHFWLSWHGPCRTTTRRSSSNLTGEPMFPEPDGGTRECRRPFFSAAWSERSRACRSHLPPKKGG